MPPFARTVLTIAASAAGTAAVAAPLAVPLDRATRVAHDPVIVADLDTVVAVWAGVVEGRSAIVSARREGAAWSMSSVVDSSDAGECSEPAAVLRDGTAAVAWVRSGDAGDSLLFRRGDGDVEAIAVSRVRIDAPSLAFSADGEPVIAWSEGGAGRFGIMAAVRGDRGWTSTPISSSLDAYDIAPRALGDGPTVYWYSLRGQDFLLLASRLVDGDWRAADAGGLAMLPANRLPLVHAVPGAAGAVWVEPLGGGEVLWAFDPRTDSSAAFPLVGAEIAASQTEPDAFGGSDQTIYAWREEGPAGSGISVLRGERSWFVGDVPHAVQPRVAETSEGIHLAFASDEIEGGTGLVYWVVLK